MATTGGDAELLARFRTVEAELLARWPENRIAPDLSRVTRVLALLGDPQLATPVIHLAGTNGKTSTARMVESLLRSLGLRTGLYTSPHLHSVRERIQLSGEPLSVATFLDAYDDVRPYLKIADEESVAAGGGRLSYFEVLTVLAFATFADAPVDVAVVETGLGGTWDATNVVASAVAVVTPVDLDHQHYLGDTVEQIADEKAGIIKAGGRIVLSQQSQPAAEVLLGRVAEMGASVVRDGIDFAVLGRRVAVGGQQVSLQGLAARYDEVFLPLFGAYQAHNAAVALAAVESFVGDGREVLDEDAVRQGFAAVSSPGRLEVVRGGPTVVVDAAHNPHGSRALVAALRDSFTFTHLVGVVAVLDDKDAAGMLAELEPLLAEVIVTTSSSPRALDADDLAAVAVDVFGSGRVEVVARLPEAIELAVERADEAAAELGGGAGVLVTGSVVTAADARLLLGHGDQGP